MMFVLSLVACQEVDCVRPSQLDLVAFSTEGRALWATGVTGGFGGCPKTTTRTTLTLSADAEPVVEESEWVIGSDDLPDQPAEFDAAFRAGQLDCDDCLLDIASVDVVTHSARVSMVAEGEHAFHIELLDEGGAVLSEGDI